MAMMIITHLFHMLPQLLVTVGCVIYLGRGNKLAGVLMLIGNLFGLLAGIFSLIIQCLIVSNAIEPVLMGRIYTFVTPVWIITGLTFGIGFIVMAMNTLKSSQAAPADYSQPIQSFQEAEL